MNMTLGKIMPQRVSCTRNARSSRELNLTLCKLGKLTKLNAWSCSKVSWFLCSFYDAGMDAKIDANMYIG